MVYHSIYEEEGGFEKTVFPCGRGLTRLPPPSPQIVKTGSVFNHISAICRWNILSLEMGERKERSCKTPQHSAGMNEIACLRVKCASESVCSPVKNCMWAQPLSCSRWFSLRCCNVVHSFARDPRFLSRPYGEGGKSGCKELMKAWRKEE